MSEVKQTNPEKKFWNYYALCYDAISNLIPYQQMMADVVKELNLKPEERLLDAGCGTGNLELTIWNDFKNKYSNKNLRIDAIDFSESMLARAIKKCEGINEISFRWVDLNKKLQYPDNVFDKIVSVNVLYALDANNILSEFNRLLKPKGTLALANPTPEFNQTKIFTAHLSNIKNIKVFLRTFTIFPMIISVGLLNLIINLKENKGDFISLSKKELESLLQKISFKNININSTYNNQNFLITAQKGEV